MPIPTQCQPIADRISILEQEKRAIGEELQAAPTPMKAHLAGLVKRYISLIQAEKRALDECRSKYGTPIPQPLVATCTGTVEFTTTFPQAPGTYRGAVTIGLWFDGTRNSVLVTSLSIDPVIFSTPFGNNTLSISKIGGGSGVYSKQTGDLAVSLLLGFDNSIDLPFVEEDSELSITLSTAPPFGSPVTSMGQVTVAGSGVFQKGIFLNGFTGTIVAVGTITPVP